jgi:hypothetical protein
MDGDLSPRSKDCKVGKRSFDDPPEAEADEAGPPVDVGFKAAVEPGPACDAIVLLLRDSSEDEEDSLSLLTLVSSSAVRCFFLGSPEAVESEDLEDAEEQANDDLMLAAEVLLSPLPGGAARTLFSPDTAARDFTSSVEPTSKMPRCAGIPGERDVEGPRGADIPGGRPKKIVNEGEDIPKRKQLTYQQRLHLYPESYHRSKENYRAKRSMKCAVVRGNKKKGGNKNW